MEDRLTALQDTPKEALNLTLDPVLDLRAAASLKDMLQQGLARGVPLTLDAGAVARMSTACVQVLTAAILEARKNAVTLALKKSSPVFDAAFVALGLASILDTIKLQDTK